MKIKMLIAKARRYFSSARKVSNATISLSAIVDSAKEAQKHTKLELKLLDEEIDTLDKKLKKMEKEVLEKAGDIKKKKAAAVKLAAEGIALADLIQKHLLTPAQAETGTAVEGKAPLSKKG